MKKCYIVFKFVFKLPIHFLSFWFNRILLPFFFTFQMEEDLDI